MSETLKTRYTFRLRPSRTAVRRLKQEWGRCRWLWNRLVEESKTIHQQNVEALANGVPKEELATFGWATQDKMLTRLRAEMVDEETGERWLAAGSSVAQQQTVRDFAAARTKALADITGKVPVSQRRGLPRLKSRHRTLPTLNYTRQGFSIVAHPETGVDALKLAGGIVIPVVWSRNLPSDPSSVRIRRDSLGHWYASFVVDVPTEPLDPTPDADPLGVDWGVETVATTTDPELDFDHKERGKKAARRLARYQRMMARRRPAKGKSASNGYKHARRQVAKVHKKVSRQRQDDARKWAKKVVRNRDRIAVEDFQPKFLARSFMARKAADGMIATVKAELCWMATKHCRDLRLVNPRHTTMDCAVCGARAKHRLPLGERTYTCSRCGSVKPRDKNSAAVMVVRAGFDPADVDRGRPARPPDVKAA